MDDMERADRLDDRPAQSQVKAGSDWAAWTASDGVQTSNLGGEWAQTTQRLPICRWFAEQAQDGASGGRADKKLPPLAAKLARLTVSGGVWEQPPGKRLKAPGRPQTCVRCARGGATALNWMRRCRRTNAGSAIQSPLGRRGSAAIRLQAIAWRWR